MLLLSWRKPSKPERQIGAYVAKEPVTWRINRRRHSRLCGGISAKFSTSGDRVSSSPLLCDAADLYSVTGTGTDSSCLRFCLITSLASGTTNHNRFKNAKERSAEASTKNQALLAAQLLCLMAVVPGSAACEPFIGWALDLVACIAMSYGLILMATAIQGLMTRNNLSFGSGLSRTRSSSRVPMTW